MSESGNHDALSCCPLEEYQLHAVIAWAVIPLLLPVWVALLCTVWREKRKCSEPPTDRLAECKPAGQNAHEGQS